MSKAGARRSAPPPKDPTAPKTKPASPPALPLAARGVSAPKVPQRASPLGSQTTSRVQAPRVPQLRLPPTALEKTPVPPRLGTEGSSDVEADDPDEAKTKIAPIESVLPSPVVVGTAAAVPHTAVPHTAVAPVGPPPALVVSAPPAALQQHAGSVPVPPPHAPGPPPRTTTVDASEETRAMVLAMVVAKLEPLQKALRDAERHLHELERRVATLRQPTVSPRIAPLAMRAERAEPDLEAASVGPIDVDVSPFDGRRRRRRMMLLFAFGVLAVFGGLFAMLALSYTPAR